VPLLAIALVIVAIPIALAVVMDRCLTRVLNEASTQATDKRDMSWNELTLHVRQQIKCQLMLIVAKNSYTDPSVGGEMSGKTEC